MVDLVEYIQNKAKMKMMNDALSYIKRDIKKFDSVEAVKKWIKSE